MEKEVLRLFQAAMTAADDAARLSFDGGGEEEESRCIEALDCLKKFPVDNRLLRSTQVGKHLRRLRKHPSKKIQTHSFDLLDFWKNIISKQVNNIDNKLRSLGNKQYVKEKPAEAEEKNILKAKATTRTKILQEENSKPETSFITNETNDAFRDKVRKIVCEALSKVSDEANHDDDIRNSVNKCDIIEISGSVERVMFQNWGKFNGEMKNKYRSLLFNLKDPKNPDLRRKVVLGEVKPEMLVKMSAEELASDERQQQIQLIKEKALVECERKDDDTVQNSDQLLRLSRVRQ